MKKMLLVIIVFILGFSFKLQAATPVPATPTVMVIDYECYQAKINGGTNPSSDFAKYCAVECPRHCLYKVDPTTSDLIRINSWCSDAGGGIAASAYICRSEPQDLDLTDNNLQLVNLFGITADRFLLILVRRILLGVMALAGIIIIGLGLYAMYKYSFADGNEEKMQEAVKIFKSLAVGAVMTFAGVSLVQIAALVSGVTGDFFDFNFLPRSGRAVAVYYDDIGKACLPEQVPLTPVINGQTVKCDPVTKVWSF